MRSRLAVSQAETFGTQIAGLERQGLKLNNSFIAVEVNITKAGDNVRTN